MIEELIRQEYFETLESDPYNCLVENVRKLSKDKLFNICHLLPWRVYWQRKLKFYVPNNSSGYKLKILNTNNGECLYFCTGFLRYYEKSTLVKDHVLPYEWVNIVVGITELFDKELTAKQKINLLKE